MQLLIYEFCFYLSERYFVAQVIILCDRIFQCKFAMFEIIIVSNIDTYVSIKLSEVATILHCDNFINIYQR